MLPGKKAVLFEIFGNRELKNLFRGLAKVNLFQKEIPISAYAKTTRMLMFLLFTIMVSGILAGPLMADAGRQLNDQDISDAVEDKLMLDGVVPVHRININTVAGIVTLSGTVDTILAKQRALRVAQTVRGVKSVINTIVVTPVFRADRDVERDIRKAFSRNPALAAKKLNPEVKKSIVTLSGTVESWPEHDVAIKLAQSVKGVSNVRDNISINFAGKRTDEEIRNDVVQALKWDALVGRNRVQIDVRNGTVTLTGSVGSAAEKTRAVSLALVNGVQQVDATKLDVAAWLKQDSVPADNAVVTDDQIKKAVENALLADPRTNVFRISVQVKGRVVTLRGVVETLAAKRAAQQNSLNTMKVIAVKNRLKVNPNQEIEDSRIAEDVRDALASDPSVDRYQINVQVIGGIAYLTGVVDTLFEKAEAEFAASQVKGVVDVKNQLTAWDITPYVYDPLVDDYLFYDLINPESETMSPKEEAKLRQDIRDQLFWSPFVDADQVKVNINGRAVTLTRTVDSLYEKDMAEKNAFDGGASIVFNNLNVK